MLDVMAQLMLEDAVLATGRTPETIEGWISSGQVDAERAGDAWLIDLSSLLNVAARDDASANGNGAGHASHGSPIDAEPDAFGGTHASGAAIATAAPIAAARTGDGAQAPPNDPAPTSVADAAAATPPPMPAQASRSVALETADGETVSTAALARTEPAERPAVAYTVDVATSAIGALNDRLEQAMNEIERLQDERLKLALQLGYAQSQLKHAQEQLRILSAPPESGSIRAILRRIFGR